MHLAAKITLLKLFAKNFESNNSNLCKNVSLSIQFREKQGRLTSKRPMRERRPKFTEMEKLQGLQNCKLVAVERPRFTKRAFQRRNFFW